MRVFVFLLVLTVVFSACDDGKSDYIVTIHTEYGDMKAILYEETPLHKENFIELAKSGAYDSTTWHRVMKDFMVQGGDVYAKEGGQEPTDDRIPAEIVEGFYHTKGALAAARQNDEVNPEKKSSGAQFYIVDGRTFSEVELTTDQVSLNQTITQMLQDDKYDSLRQIFIDMSLTGVSGDSISRYALTCKDYVEQEMGVDFNKDDVDPKQIEIYTITEGAPHLDNKYTVFGRVVEGLGVIDRIAAVQVNNNNRPLTPTYLSVELEKVPKEEITQKYSYEYPVE